MRYTLLLAALLLIGCGGSNSAPQAPGPFADIDGTYLGTVASNSGTYAAGTTVGDTKSATILGNGVIKTTDQGGGQIIFQLTRLGDGSFQTLRRTIDGSHYEVGTAPASLATFTLQEYETAGDVWVGSVSYSLVQTSSG